MLSLNRGTYGASVCVKPATGAFKSAASFALEGTVFVMSPATLSAV